MPDVSALLIPPDESPWSESSVVTLTVRLEPTLDCDGANR